MRRYAFLAAATIALSGCANPDDQIHSYMLVLNECAPLGTSLDDATRCLTKKHIQVTPNTRREIGQTYSYVRCEPTWGYPLYSSCGGVSLLVDSDNRVSGTQSGAEIEKLWGPAVAIEYRESTMVFEVIQEPSDQSPHPPTETAEAPATVAGERKH